MDPEAYWLIHLEESSSSKKGDWDSSSSFQDSIWYMRNPMVDLDAWSWLNNVLRRPTKSAFAKADVQEMGIDDLFFGGAKGFGSQALT